MTTMIQGVARPQMNHSKPLPIFSNLKLIWAKIKSLASLELIKDLHYNNSSLYQSIVAKITWASPTLTVVEISTSTTITLARGSMTRTMALILISTQ